MNTATLKEEILRMFDELTLEEQEDCYEKAVKMLLENAHKAEWEE